MSSNRTVIALVAGSTITDVGVSAPSDELADTNVTVLFFPSPRRGMEVKVSASERL